jgi:hypothetical protein
MLLWLAESSGVDQEINITSEVSSCISIQEFYVSERRDSQSHPMGRY